MGLDVGEIGMPLDLGLDLKLFVARTAGRMAKEAPAVDACIRSLEEERRKIEVFRRELPLCMHLLADVIEVMKEEAGKKIERRDADAKAEVDTDKRKWMSTAQLWVDNRASDANSVKEQKNHKSILSEPVLCGGAPVPLIAVGCGAPQPSQYFKGEDRVASTEGRLPGIPVMSPPIANKPPFSPVSEDRARALTARLTACMPPPGLSLHTQEQARKTRRCWSPELHRQFVAALRQLGGLQVATPKQIREVMMVDGLTNDEVKSHLQKYRLHKQRSPGSSSLSHPIIMIGDLWGHQEQSSSQSGSPEGPLQFSGSGVSVSAVTGSDSSEVDDRSQGYSRK